MILLLPLLLWTNEAFPQAQPLMPPMVNAPWQPAWAKGTEEATLLTVTVNLSSMATAGTAFTLTAGSVSVTNTGLDCNTWTNADKCEIPVKPYQPFQLTVSGSSIRRVNMDLVAPPLVDLGVRRTVRNRPTTPARFKLYVDGVQTNTIDEYSTNFNCTTYLRTWSLELRHDKDAPRRNSLGRNDETAVPENQAPGDADWPEIGPGKSLSPGIGPIKWSVGMGRLNSGRSAGRLHYMEYGLNSNSYTPSSLYFYQPFTNHSQVVVVTNSAITNASVLRQIKTPQTFVDIPGTNTNSFELRFYLLSQVSANINTNTGYYDILTNSPFVLWRFSNPDQSPTNTRRLLLMEQRAGTTWTNDIAYDSTNQVWSLTRGTGSEQYRETRAISMQTVLNVVDEWTQYTSTNRFETNRVTDGSGAIAYEAIENYQLFDWGWGLISTVTDPSNAALTTSYEYFVGDEALSSGGNDISRISYPDGSWEMRTYVNDYNALGNRVLERVVMPFKDSTADSLPADSLPDSSQCLVNWYSYDHLYGETYVHHIYRRETNALYRYDTTKKYVVLANGLEGETFQIGWLPDCVGSRAREGAVRWPDYAAAECFGQVSQTLTNYNIGVTNSYEFGTWSSSSFSPGTGTDWRKTSIRGLGSLYDNEAYTADKVDTIPGKSTKQCEIRAGGLLACSEFYVYSDSTINGTSFTLVYSDFNTNDAIGHSIGQGRVDAVSSNQRTLHTADWKATNQFPGQLLLSKTDEDGLTTAYTYDSLKRLKSRTLVGANGLPDYVISYNYDACGRVLLVQTNGGSLSLSNQFAFDRSGRVTKTIDQVKMTNSYTYYDGGRATCITYANKSTLVKSNYLSGELKSETGTSAVPKYYSSEYFDTTFGSDPPHQSSTMAVCRTTSLVTPDSWRRTMKGYNIWDTLAAEIIQGSEMTFTNRYFYANSDENLTSTESPSLDANNPIQQYYAYDTENNPTASWLYVDGGSPSHFTANLPPMETSRDRLTKTEALYTNISGAWFRATNCYIYLGDYDATATCTSQARQRLNGFAAGVKAETTSIDVHSNTLTQTLYVDRSAKMVTSAAVSSTSTLPATNVLINGLLQSESSFTVAKPTLHSYDSLRRETQILSPAGATTTTSYESAGRKATITDFAGNMTTLAYYGNTHTNAGRISSITAANGKKTYYAYNFRGDLIRTWGDVPYPEERVYSDYGEVVELHTYRGGSGWSGSSWPASPGTADVTTWNYHPWSGLLTSKTDASAASVTYAYFDNNLLMYRAWARGVVSSNHYSSLGDLGRLDYSDGTAPVVYTNYSRDGLPRLVRDATGDHVLSYDYATRLVSDACTNGDFNGITIANHFVQLYGRDYVQAQIAGQTTIEDDYGYDSYGRQNSAAYGVYSASYAYLPNSDRLQTTASKNNGSTVLTTTRIWQSGERLQSIANVVNGVSVSSRNYLYDQLHRRTQATVEDASLWKYGYNDRSEVISGKRYWADWTPVAGQQYEFVHDNIGNRTSTQAGGDSGGANLRLATYGANALNQYTNRTVPGAADIIGAAQATATAKVNGQTTYRKVEYYQKALACNNTNAALYQSITNTAESAPNTNTITGNIFLPQTPETFTYDLDGNLTADGRWSYTWDAENRLTQMIGLGGAPTASKRSLVFAYDQMGRRTRKTVYDGSSGSYILISDVRFVYDRWNLLAELNATNNAPIRSYLWGQDLSGTKNKAGGSGGLTTLREHAGGTYHFAAYDANGNLMALVNAGDQTVSAKYEYSPFGETTRLTGSLAKANPFRFCTKYTDDESGLLAFPRRFFAPSMGKWLSRDPLGEDGGIHLTAFCVNDPINKIDVAGTKALITMGEMLPEAFESLTKMFNQNTMSSMARIRNFNNVMEAGYEFGQMIGDAGVNVFETGVRILHMGIEGSQALHDFVDNAQDYARDMRDGDVAMADLDAIGIATSLMDATGDYALGYAVMDYLLTP